MSGSGKTEPGSLGAGDPSMEDILASIRRILSEEEAAPNDHPAPPEKPPEDDVLVLDPSMLVPEEAVQPKPGEAKTGEAKTSEAKITEAKPPAPSPELEPPRAHEIDPTLVAPEAARAAAAAVAGLVRTLASERGTQTYAGGPTIEDLVRAELRPILKEWLDLHLPGLVERLVRTEIERLVNRAAH